MLVFFQMFSRLILSWHCTELWQPQGPRVFQSPMGLLPNALHLKEVAEVKQSCEYESVCWKLQCPLSFPGMWHGPSSAKGSAQHFTWVFSPCCCAETCSISSPHSGFEYIPWIPVVLFWVGQAVLRFQSHEERDVASPYISGWIVCWSIYSDAWSWCSLSFITINCISNAKLWIQGD